MTNTPEATSNKRIPTMSEAMAGIFPKTKTEPGNAFKTVLGLARKMALTKDEKDACNYVRNYMHIHWGVKE